MVDNKTSKVKQAYFLTPEAILKYFLGSDDNIDTLIKCKTEDIKITTTDNNLYEALGALQQHDEFHVNKLVKFLESVDIDHSNKKILTHARVDELRNVALKK